MKKVFLFLALAAINAWATPNLVSYQGKLDRDGSPFTGTASMEFALFETETGSTSFWNETQSVTVTDGIFNVLLGSITELPPLPTDGCWLEVTIDGDALPRQQITSVPYAELAQQVCANYQMVHDTTMNYTVPIGGTLLVGYFVTQEESPGWLTLYVDDTKIFARQSYYTTSFFCGAVPIEAGNHRIHLKGPLLSLEKCDITLWAIFMR